VCRSNVADKERKYDILDVIFLEVNTNFSPMCLRRGHDTRIKAKEYKYKTSEPQRHNVEMYPSAVISFTHLYTYDFYF